MKAIVIDDEPWMLRHFREECVGLKKIELIGCYRNPLTALEYAQSHPLDLAFVDVEMPQLDGIETAKRLCTVLPDVKIVITSAYDESYIETMYGPSAYAYLRKPYQKDDLKTVLDTITAG